MEVQVDEEKIKKMEESHKKKQKKKNSKRIIIVVVVILIISCAVLFKIRSDDGITAQGHAEAKVIKTLVGKWTTDGNTVYEFEKDGRGTLIVPTITVPFSYKLEDDNKVHVDFENEDSEDKTYTYELTDEKLVLKNIDGVFEFSRVEE